MYQKMRGLIDPRSTKGNTDSVHYLMLPECRCAQTFVNKEITRRERWQLKEGHCGQLEEMFLDYLEEPSIVNLWSESCFLRKTLNNFVPSIFPLYVDHVSA